MISTRRTISKIWTLLNRAERRDLVGLFAAMLVGMVLETLGVGLVIPVIALLTQPDYLQRFPSLAPYVVMLGNPDQRTLVLWSMSGLTLVFLVKNLFLGVLTWWQTKFATDVQAQLSQRLFTIYLSQPYLFHLRRNSAQLIRNTITEVSHMTGRVLTPALHLVTECLVVAGLCVLLLVVEPVGALIAVSILGSATWAFHRVTRTRTLHWGKARQYHEGLRIQHLQQGLGGIKEIKLLGRESHFEAMYNLHNVQSARASEFHATLQQLTRLWLEFLAVAGIVGVVVVMVVRGRELSTIVPTMGLFAAVGFRLMPSANRILLAVQSLRYSTPTVDVLHEELQLAAEKPAPAKAVDQTFEREIRLNSVTFTYPGSPLPALDRLTLSIAKSDCVGFVGSSGSGKSTLVNVILGLLAPTEGTVVVDGQDIQGRLRAWQDHIGYVPQSIYLTDDTLRRNIAFGVPDEAIDDAAVSRALKAAQLEDFVSTLPKGIATVVGERGVRLSGGQVQRIGIARALYHDPAVLVLDEATSSLDSPTERDVMEAVDALHGTKTILVVAHRLSTVAHCDRLYRLEYGRLTEEAPVSRILDI